MKRIFDPVRSPTVTREMIGEMAHAVTHGALEERENQSRLTGKSIVFAKDQGRNCYMTLANHTTGDQQIFDEIKSVAYADFSFLA